MLKRTRCRSANSRLAGALLALGAMLTTSVPAAVRVVEDVPEAAVKKDDRILAMHGGGRTFEVHDPLGFELAWLRCSAQRTCSIAIERAGERLTLPLWQAEVRVVPERLDLSAEINPNDPLRTDTTAAQREPMIAAWLHMRRAERSVLDGNLDAAARAANDARAVLSAPEEQAFVSIEFARLLLSKNQLDETAAELDALIGQKMPVDLRVRAVRLRGAVHFRRAQLAEAEAGMRAVIDQARAAAPGSHLLASTLNSLAVVIRPQGRLHEARALFEEARANAVAFGSPSVLEVMILSNMALLERAAGDLQRADLVFREALAMLDKLPPQPLLRFDTEANWALVLLDRGRTREAAAFWNTRLLDEGLDQERVGQVLHNLALVFAAQGDFHEAVRRLRLALAHWQRVAPGGIEEASVHRDLGAFAAETGEFAAARRALKTALRLYRAIAPNGTGVIGALDAHATLSLAMNDAAGAERWQRQALSLRERSEQPGWRRDAALTQLAQALHAQRKDDAALAALAEAQAHARGAGRDAMLASALALRGDILLRRGEAEAARKAACDGVERIEILRGTSPRGAEFQTPFTHQAAPIYRSCIDAMLAVGDIEAALGSYQRERRGVLQALLDDRDLRFRELPPDLAQERGAALAALQSISAELDAAPSAELAALKERRFAARAQLRRVDERITAALPQLLPWSAERTSAPTRAPIGHTVVAFAVGKSDTLRIVLSDRAPRVDRLPLSAAQLSGRVAAWRTALQRGAADEIQIARELYAALLAGVALEDSVVLVPDGALHRLPFAALIGSDNRRLIETHAVALAALLPDAVPCTARSCAANASLDLLALADSASVAGRAALPGVDLEVDGLKNSGWKRVAVLRGADASAEALFDHGPKARRLHFALHGMHDATSPMDSALMLRAGNATQPLAVWRIFEELRLDAELVVLAACDTAPGAGERDDGWLGLTRAFQFAGTAQVVSALWPVGDRSTAALMAQFHRHLAAGETPTMALAMSQRQALRAVPDRGKDPDRGVGGVAPAATSGNTAWAAFHVYWAPQRERASQPTRR